MNDSSRLQHIDKNCNEKSILGSSASSEIFSGDGLVCAHGQKNFRVR